MSRKRTSVSGDVRKVREFRVELRRFVDENEFQKQGDWFILPQILELEIDPTISSESNGLLDEEYDSDCQINSMTSSYIVADGSGNRLPI